MYLTVFNNFEQLSREHLEKGAMVITGGGLLNINEATLKRWTAWVANSEKFERLKYLANEEGGREQLLGARSYADKLGELLLLMQNEVKGLSFAAVPFELLETFCERKKLLIHAGHWTLLEHPYFHFVSRGLKMLEVAGRQGSRLRNSMGEMEPRDVHIRHVHTFRTASHAMTMKVVAEAMETSEWCDDCGREAANSLKKLAKNVMAGLAQECAV